MDPNNECACPGAGLQPDLCIPEMGPQPARGAPNSSAPPLPPPPQGNGRCDVVVAGITVRQFYTDSNVTFTWPTLRGGWRILVNSEEEPVDYWAFLDAFSWQLWLATILTLFGVGFVIWFVERWALLGHKPRPGSPPLAPLSRHVWRSLGRPMQVG
jgi:hypothetical protein